MIPAPGAGSEGTKKKRKRKRSGKPRGPQPQTQAAAQKSPQAKRPYAKRVDEVSAGGLVIDTTGTMGLLIGRYDHKDATGKRVLWSLPKGHIEEGETPEQAAIREVAEETGITSSITKSLGVIDFWFMAGGKRIHKTVHHFQFTEVGGTLAAQESEVDEVSWFPLSEIVDRLAYPDEKKLIARTAELSE
ncbi:MutT NTP pyrophosphohydrolases including oxidative damage repair enzymes [Candidatus Nanopelagicaceae bacterium]|jgi:8-oxo-dGTP pyrophosphatase MutT (NUDIX family)